MGSVAEAVLEFDESVQVPWRPPLAEAARPVERSSGLPVFAPPTTRRPRGARVSRLTVPPAPGSDRQAPLRRAPGGSTAVGHACTRCAPGDRPAPALRLTRRARRLLSVLVAAVAILLAVWVGSVAGGDDEDLVLVSDSSVVVRQGDTLWSIAGSVADGEDVRGVVDAIQALNDLHGSALRPGQVLRLP